MTSAPFSVLLVEDDPDFQTMFRAIVEYSGNQLIVTPDAESAIEYLVLHTPDVIVMDIFLPGVDGYKALQYMRKYALVKDCSVVATTAYFTDHTPKELMAWGFSGYLPKPFDPDKVVPYLEQVIESRQRQHTS
jgi:CheY-like chemotaxis protein